MDDSSTCVWLEFARKGKRNLLLGAIYRELKTGIPKPNNTGDVGQQISRWRQILRQWSKVGRRNGTYVIEDTNLDFHSWDNPSQICRQMVEDTKAEIETLGFHQLINFTTRTWRGQRDSCIDQVWTNVTETSICTFVHTRGSSDHCVVGVTISIKGSDGDKLEFLSIKRNTFDLNTYINSLKASDWGTFYSMSNVGTANHWLEEILREALQRECPITKMQPNKKLNKNWAVKDLVTKKMREIK